jgi:hypothetical protein
MSDPYLLKTLHVASALGVFTALGAILLGGKEVNRKVVSILHGISLLLLVLVGFAMLRKPPMELHYWKIKLLIWLFLGVVPVLARKEKLPRGILLLLTLVAAGYAAYLGLRKPF